MMEINPEKSRDKSLSEIFFFFLSVYAKKFKEHPNKKNDDNLAIMGARIIPP